MRQKQSVYVCVLVEMSGWLLLMVIDWNEWKLLRKENGFDMNYPRQVWIEKALYLYFFLNKSKSFFSIRELATFINWNSMHYNGFPRKSFAINIYKLSLFHWDILKFKNGYLQRSFAWNVFLGWKAHIKEIRESSELYFMWNLSLVRHTFTLK